MAPNKKRPLPTEPSHQKDGDYNGGITYWASQPASIDGVLGGYGNLTSIDALSSRMFLLTVMQRLSKISKKPEEQENEQARPRTRALDIGSGVGRVTQSVLLPLVDEVDVVEPVEHLVMEAKRAAEAKEWKSLEQSKQEGSTSKKVVRFYKRGLQDFDPQIPENDGLIGTISLNTAEVVATSSEAGYDVLWCQWCLGHLSDDQLVEWFKKCKKALKSTKDNDAVIIVKENTTRTTTRDYDSDDKSWTRSPKLWKEIFQKSGLKLIREEQQKGFPQELYPVWMYALR